MKSSELSALRKSEWTEERRAYQSALFKGKAVHTAESKRGISEKLRGRKCTSEHCANISAGLKGRKLSPEHCANISAAKKGIPKTPEAIQSASAHWAQRTRRERLQECLKKVGGCRGVGHYLARSLYPDPLGLCEGCHKREAKERHHKDDNPWNNYRTNLRFLCYICHKKTKKKGRRL